MSRRPSTRSHFAGLFRAGAPVVKSYTAVCELATDEAPPQRAELVHHIADRMLTCRGVITGKLQLTTAIIPPLHPLPVL